MRGHALQLQLAYGLWVMGYGPPQTEVKSISVVTHLPLISSSVQLVAHNVM